jgi:hypothetical protein
MPTLQHLEHIIEGVFKTTINRMPGYKSAALAMRDKDGVFHQIAEFLHYEDDGLDEEAMVDELCAVIGYVHERMAEDGFSVVSQDYLPILRKKVFGFRMVDMTERMGTASEMAERLAIRFNDAEPEFTFWRRAAPPAHIAATTARAELVEWMTQ